MTIKEILSDQRKFEQVAKEVFKSVNTGKSHLIKAPNG